MSFDPTYPHELTPLPPVGISNSDFYELLLPARVALAELKGACSEMPNPMLLMAPIMVRESVASSNIENINTTLANVLQGQLFPEVEQRPPDKEVSSGTKPDCQPDHAKAFIHTSTCSGCQ